MENWEALIAGGPIAALIAYFGFKRQLKKDEFSVVTDKYKVLLDEYSKNHEQIKKELKEVREEVGKLNEIIVLNTGEIEKLKKENLELHKDLELWKDKYFDLYKKYQAL